MAGRAPGPLRPPSGFWNRPEFLGALRERDFAALFRLLTKYAGASQTQIAIAVGMTQGQISTIVGGDRRVTALDVAERALDGLGAPDQARVAFGLAPHDLSRLDRGAHSAGPFERQLDTWRSTPDEKATDEPVHRRDMLRLGGLGAVGAATAMRAATARGLAGVARALTFYGPLVTDVGPSGTISVGAFAKGVAAAKRNYQAYRYSAVVEDLPVLLQMARALCATSSGDELQLAYRLAADAYQVTGSVMLKLSDAGLAALAADRSMDAAERSEDPVVVAASAPVVTHSLMSGGHAAQAAEVATRAAEYLDRAVSAPSPDAISVYGALILRGAIAAAKREDRANAAVLLDEADDAGRRLGRDDNAHWTGFGPTNVALHRVNVALTLGDAGTALAIRRADRSRLHPARRAEGEPVLGHRRGVRTVG
jgi:hypothetical protein